MTTDTTSAAPSDAELMKAAVKQSHELYKLPTSRAAFQAGVLFAHKEIAKQCAPQPACAAPGERLRDELVDLARSIVDFYKERSTVLQVHVENMADLLEELAAAPTTQAAPQPAAQHRAPSPTSGMTLAQRILHVGGRNNAAGYVEFGSTQAVEALVRQVIRDLPPHANTAAPVAQGDALTPAEADQLEKAITDFEECGETDVPDAALQRFAAMGYLECVHYNVLPAAHKAIDAARSQAKEGGA